ERDASGHERRAALARPREARGRPRRVQRPSRRPVAQPTALSLARALMRTYVRFGYVDLGERVLTTVNGRRMLCRAEVADRRRRCRMRSRRSSRIRGGGSSQAVIGAFCCGLILRVADGGSQSMLRSRTPVLLLRALP